ncbi:MAG: GNAT family N-acetyltransferase [Prevotella sp.]|nr:GNAT family N-acetyltransferase [Prevotella sp.]MCM1074703.1 GNAT family N-acetyltransferase [Ruminococcus sp.]
MNLIELYTNAFPEDERRPWQTEADVQEFMKQNPSMKILTKCSSENQLTAFAIYWQLSPTLRYLEHLATIPELRGHGLGAELVRQLLDAGRQSLLLEVEPPIDEITMRRVKFYERQGLIIHNDLEYIQPPYAADLSSVELRIMTTPNISDSELQDSIIPKLRQIVYNTKDDKPE